ncbi:uncharacterized protein BJ212DRAFT_1305753 [Suillus subaureus]|uniref:Uncharacterized protein n=1 Tax=Suillus subaureus TaxID=48587 RepID=A0A9P7DM92_9AGAM|nr:uncharacterized protein BJ212DRAFT_1305753 [Suillus subaureus]KAG1798350.1 hypothetical protein BJ212DRAFT_1305753 [Suillus subaureus]
MHQDAVAIIGFLAMPKTMKEYAEDPKFCAFRCQLFHSSLSHILETLRPAMTKPEVAKFRDGHFQQVIYGLGPYIADYEEQVLLAYILWFEFGIISNLIGFKQWMGDDLKALMKVYLAAIEGHNFATSYAKIPSPRALWMRLKMPSSVIITTTQFLQSLAQFPPSCCHANIPLSTTPILFCDLVLPMDSAHLSLRANISRLSKSHGGTQANTKHSVRSAHVDFANHWMLDNTCLAAELEALSLADTDSNNNSNVQVHPLPSSVANEVQVAVDHGLTILQAHTWLAQTVCE